MAGPAAEGVIERRRAFKSEQPGDMGGGESLLLQILQRQAVTKLIDDLGESRLLAGEAPGERANAETQRIRNRRRAWLALGQRRLDLVFDGVPQRAARRRPLSQGVLAERSQGREKVVVARDQRRGE